MAMRRRAIVAWSGGKDSTLALHALRRDPSIAVDGLLTFISDDTARVAHHKVPDAVMRDQAAALGLPLYEIRMPPNPDNATYEAHMAQAVTDACARGVTLCAFGDLFLEDVRDYRIDRLKGTGIDPIFPLWGQDTTALAREFVALGYKARVVCVDTDQLDGSFAGRDLDGSFLDDLPDGVDPCGENGEFHSFVYDGPIFSHPVPLTPGRNVTESHFVHFLMDHR